MKTGVTLVELMIVVAVIAILATIIMGVATHVDNQARERLTKGTIGILEAALRQFQDYEYEYKVPATVNPAEITFFRSLEFPLDCNNFDVAALQATLPIVLGGAVVSIGAGSHLNEYSGSEVLYFFLNSIPTSRKTLEKIDETLVTSEDFNKQPMNISVGGKSYPLLRIIDAWGTTLRYDYYNRMQVIPVLRGLSRRTFPVITSAGPDRIFGTLDDISSRN